MAFADRLDQRQAQADAALTLAGTGQPVKRLKNAFPLRAGHARPPVQHFDDGALLAARASLRQFQADIALAVTPGIFKQVANQPAQQPGRALHRQAVAGIRAVGQFGLQFGMHACAFLSGQPGQVQRFKRLGIGLLGVQPAGQQNLVDELVKLIDAARNFHALRRRHVHTHQLQSHADTRQR